MRKVYQKPNIEFLRFDILDKITNDDGNVDDDWGAADSGGFEEW